MANKEWIVEGNVWRVGKNVNTESIVPSRWLHEGTEPLMQHIAEVLIPEFPKKAQKNDIWVGGVNLGCSSARNAPLFLKIKGIGVIICSSSARTFYRNALNSGIPIFEIGDEVSKIKMGDKLRVDVVSGEIKNLTTGETIQAKKFPDFMLTILQAGSIKQWILNRKSEYKFLK
jgi:3-isopropylmalate/(R)-2-methylmalate dehydratase small subunit